MPPPFRIIIAALGSYGDVHPFLAIGKELRARGHEVLLILPAMYESLVQKLGLEFAAAGTVEQFERISSQRDLWHPIKGFEVIARGVGESLPWFYEPIVRNHLPGRTGLVMSSLMMAGRIAQEKLGISGVTVHLSPVVLRSDIDPPATPPLPLSPRLPRVWNRFVYWMTDRLVMDRLLSPPINEFRQSVGLKPVKGIFGDWIHSPDRVIGLFPKWFAPPPPDWPKQTVLTGFPLYDEADVTPMDAGLEEFLASGSPPIVFTPGSAMKFGEAFFAAAVESCGILKMRGILLSRYAHHFPENLPKEIRAVDFAPFSRLLPRCAAIVHHGGIGTAAQAMAAGIPQLVVTMAHDQPDNAARLRRLGVARSIMAKRLTGGREAKMIDQLLMPNAAGACAQIKERLRAGKPLGSTADEIERMFGIGSSPGCISGAQIDAC